MQSYVLKIAAGQTVPFTLLADLFVYESGVTVPDAGDTRIKIKADTGAEITLRPGQRVRLAPEDGKATRWQVMANDPAAVINGSVIIGSGEFDDANTINKFTLDATLANNVTVMNAPGAPIPTVIGNTVAQRVPVSLDTNQVINTSSGLMTYTNSFNAALETNPGLQVFAPGANVNGIIVNMWTVQNGAGANYFTFMAKAGAAPTSQADGDICDMVQTSVNGAFARMPPGGAFKVPAGKGLYIYSINSTYTSAKSVLYTVL